MDSKALKQPQDTDIQLPKPFPVESGFRYRILLKDGPWAQELENLADNSENPRRSPVTLLEDGQAIGKPHASHADIANRGEGLYSHWSSTLYFSTSDNSDPNVNGRTYSLKVNRNFGREQRLAAAIVQFLRTRLAELGPTESGFYDYYSRWAESGTPFQPYDRAILRFVLDRASHFNRYVEIGAGIGQLGALLAAEGIRAVAVEGDIQRFGAAVALHQTLSREIDGIKDNMSIIEAFFPSDRVEIDPGTLVLFTNLIHSNDEDVLLDGCRNAGAIIIDVCRFAHSRTTTDDWRALIRRIRNLGFPYVDPVFSWGEPTELHQPSPSAGRILYFYRDAVLNRTQNK